MELVMIAIVCACGHTENVRVDLDEIGPIVSELEACLCSACENDMAELQADAAIAAWEAEQERVFLASELRVCQVCSKVVAEESHCTQMTGPYNS